MADRHDSYERETINNQKRIIRELKRIGDALGNIAKNTGDQTVEADFEITVENEEE